MGLTPWKGKDSRNRGSRGLAGRAGGVMVIVTSAVTQETVVCGQPPTGDSKASILREKGGSQSAVLRAVCSAVVQGGSEAPAYSGARSSPRSSHKI